MTRYIDAELLVAEIKSNINTYWNDGGGGYYLAEDAIEYSIKTAPTADVVPKSEYDAVVSAVDNSTKEFLKLHDAYQNAKAEVAREIFEEIETCLYRPSDDMPDDVHYQIREQDYDELKKKYTEGKT